MANEPTPADPVVELSGVSKSYADGARRIVALEHVSLTIARGEFVALVGRSGSGKTTLLNLIAGIDRPTSGHISVAGTRLDSLTDREITLVRRRDIGIVFQFFNLLPALTAIENVLLPLHIAGRVTRTHEDRARELLAGLGLAGRERDFPAQFSGGEQQRLALARAVIHDPALILADEPTGNLDSETGAGVLERLEAFTRDEGRTVIMVTHSEEAVARCGRVFHLRDGRIAEQGATP